ncbi:MAG: cysteine hydrolase [Candidatus Methanomethylophilaceae archaeon]|nr:cysteine hydrolase [Candidatus Methanomethylophilaceae archaeon]
MRWIVLVVDMIEEFVTGRLGDPRMLEVVSPIRRLLDRAREAGVPVVYVRDCHRMGDPELDIMGDHAMEGSDQCGIVPELEPLAGEPVFEKSVYTAFYGTGLDEYLDGLGADTLILTGQLTEVCIRHTAADAFYRGYRTVVPNDCVQTMTDDIQTRALQEMMALYGTSIVPSSEVTF